MTRSLIQSIGLAVAFASSIYAQGQSEGAALNALGSSVHANRRAGFYSLLSLGDSTSERLPLRVRIQRFTAFAAQREDVRRAVVGLLERENSHPEEQVSEDRYRGDLILAVGAFKDPAAVNALMGVIATGRGAIHGLALLGDQAVPKLLAAVDGPSRFYALTTLSDMVTLVPAPQVSDNNRRRIRTVLLRALSDSDRYDRQTALDGLAAFPDSEVRASVARVAANDTYFVRDQGQGRYPVREAAAATLRKLDAQTIKK
jgi:hypothetical protein